MHISDTYLFIVYFAYYRIFRPRSSRKNPSSNAKNVNPMHRYYPQAHQAFPTKKGAKWVQSLGIWMIRKCFHAH